MADIKGKTVVVTGASTGIGVVLSEKLAELGAKVPMLARSSALMEEICARIHNKGGEAHKVRIRGTSSLGDDCQITYKLTLNEEHLYGTFRIRLIQRSKMMSTRLRSALNSFTSSFPTVKAFHISRVDHCLVSLLPLRSLCHPRHPTPPTPKVA